MSNSTSNTMEHKNLHFCLSNFAHIPNLIHFKIRTALQSHMVPKNLSWLLVHVTRSCNSKTVVKALKYL